MDKGFILHCYQDEHPRTQKVFGSMVDGELDYRPHPTSRSAQELVGHMIGHYDDVIEMIDDGVIHHRMTVPFDGVAGAIDHADRSAQQLLEKLGAMTDEDLSQPVKMWVGDHLAWEGSASEIMMSFLFDLIHHRGQLSTYLRPMGGSVPAIYGPSADDDGSGG